MEEVTFHGEPPSNVLTMVVAFGGWIDAGEAATGALRSLVRQLGATPLASIDPEDFCDFTQLRPVVRLTAEGERVIRWPRSAFWTWQPPAGGAGLLLFRGMEPQRRWRTYATLLLDVAARCGVQRLVSLGVVLEAVPHTRPPLVTGTSTDPAWHAWLATRGMVRRGRRYEGPTGIATWLRRRPCAAGWRISPARASAALPREHHQSGRVSRAADHARPPARPGAGCVRPSRRPCGPFGAQCDQAVAHDAAVQAYVRELEQAYDAPGDAAPRPRRDDAFNPEQLMHDLEDFLRQEREGGAE